MAHEIGWNLIGNIANLARLCKSLESPPHTFCKQARIAAPICITPASGIFLDGALDVYWSLGTIGMPNGLVPLARVWLLERIAGISDVLPSDFPPLDTQLDSGIDAAA